ncbi:MAG: 4Fe-4S binding protein [Thermovirga sp.]|nr:4Fe-4S binding protein [Thermovirga sp.]
MKNSRLLRFSIQGAFLALLSWIGYRHQVVGGGPSGVPPVDAFCPFGGLEGLFQFLTSGVWLRRLAPSSLILLLLLVGITLVFGRAFCGWICPLGTLGEWSASLGRKMNIKPRKLPTSMDSPLRYLKYVILAAIIAGTWKLGTLVWRDYDPWVAWMHLSALFKEFPEKPGGFLVLFLSVIGASFFIERFWCRYLCPLGAFLAILQKFSLTKITRAEQSCVHCHNCSRTCPVELDPESVGVERSAECIACGRCVESCPVGNTLFFRMMKKKLPVAFVGLAAVLLLFGGIAFSRITGLWQPFAPPSQGLSGPAAVDSLYGWMTISQMAEVLHVSPKDLLQLGGLDESTPLDVRVKDIPGVNDEELKERIREALSAKETSKKTSYVPPSPEEIRGSMTMRQVEETYKVRGEEAFILAGWPENLDKDTPLKDLAGDLGKEVSQIRDAVKKLLEKKQ